MAIFHSIDALQAWLDDQGIDTSNWGKGAAKSVENLWNELVNGDARIQLEPPLRLVEVVEIVIRRGHLVLVEKEQELSNGDRRKRNLPPSEKMKLGEDVIEGALRCLREELHVEADAVTFSDEEPKTEHEVVKSPSYPGLLTQYTFHRVELKVSGLSDSEFWVDNVALAQGDPVRRHKWAWCPAEVLAINSGQ